MKIQTILNRLLTIKQKKDDLKKEEEKLKAIVDKQMGEEVRIDVDGYAFIRLTTVSRKYTIESLRKFLKDEDLINSCLEPSTVKVKKAVKTAGLSKQEAAELDSEMVVVGESESIKLQKINTKS